MKEPFDYAETLKDKGLKNTKHRNSILRILDASPCPVAAEELFLTLREEGVGISLSSVYRILESLADKGLVIKSNLTGDGKFLYELQSPEHKHYLICSRCKRMTPVEGCPLSDYEKHLKETKGFTATGHKLVIYGICRDCLGGK